MPEEKENKENLIDFIYKLDWMSPEYKKLICDKLLEEKKAIFNSVTKLLKGDKNV